MISSELIEHLSEEVIGEVERAKEEHEEFFSSNHEAYAVLKEEIEETLVEIDNIMAVLDKIWESVKLDSNISGLASRMQKTALLCAAELIQVSGVCEKIIRTEEIKDEC